MKICLKAVLFFFSLTSLFPDESSSILSPAEKLWLEENNEILFVCQNQYPPFEFSDEEDNIDGMVIELIRWIATEFGFKARFNDMSFHDAQNAVLSGDADVITSLFYSLTRDEKFDFTSITWEVPALIFIKADRPDIKGLEELNGMRVAIQRGDYAQEFLDSKAIEYSPLFTDSFGEAVDKVISGEADAVVGDKQIVLYHLYSKGLMEKMKTVGDPLYIGQNSIAVKEGRTELQSILNKGVQQARKSGIFGKIDRKWMGTSYPLAVNPFLKYLPLIFLFLGSLIVIAILILFWNFQLRRKVSQRTEELRLNEIHLQSLFDSVPDLLWLKDPEGHYLKCNKRFRKLLGKKEEEIQGRSDYDFFDKPMADLFTAHDRKALREGSSVNETEIEYRSDGHREKIEIVKSSFSDGSGKLVGILGIAHDITERVRAGEKLKENETFLDAIIENIPNMVFVKEADTLKFIRFNKAAENLLGYSRSDMIGKSDYDFFPPDEAEFFTAKDREALKSADMTDISEEPITTVDGEIRYLHTQKISIKDANGNPLYLLGISEDITERKRAQEQLHKALRDKEVLLKEIHHRVKNNLQIVSSLLSLQSEKTDDPLILEAFAEAESRVRSMSLVHEILYRSDSLDRISLPVYLKNLIENLRDLYIDRDVDITVDSGEITIQLEQAVTCGLIFTELVTNSLKYAFPPLEKGNILVKIEELENSRLRAVFSDDGCGLPAGFNPREVKSLGMRLVTDLVEDQLEGTWELNGDGRTAWTIMWQAE